MVEWRSQGKTLRAIARDLNRLNIRPARAANGTPAASGASYWPLTAKAPPQGGLTLHNPDLSVTSLLSHHSCLCQY